MGYDPLQNEQKIPSLLDVLYCEEEEWEELADRDEYSTEGESLSPFEQDLLWEEGELCCLLNKQKDFDFCNLGFEMMNPSMVKARREVVEWMLKVTAYYSFSAVTAVLAVIYLDKFLLSISSNTEKKPWMTQLAAVACLSLAAKIEETQVPLLLDLQVEESKYVFEAKTIQRMEILVLSTLQWKMNIVTPLSFVDYVARRLGLKHRSCLEFLQRCGCLLLSIISDYRFIYYLPSIMATATMLHICSRGDLFLGKEYQEQLFGILQIDKDKVEECYRLMSEVTSAAYYSISMVQSWNKRKFNAAAVAMPTSPKGVMDISFMSDSSNDSWSVAASTSSVSSSEQPLSKRARLETTI